MFENERCSIRRYSVKLLLFGDEMHLRLRLHLIVHLACSQDLLLLLLHELVGWDALRPSSCLERERILRVRHHWRHEAKASKLLWTLTYLLYLRLRCKHLLLLLLLRSVLIRVMYTLKIGIRYCRVNMIFNRINHRLKAIRCGVARISVLLLELLSTLIDCGCEVLMVHTNKHFIWHIDSRLLSEHIL